MNWIDISIILGFLFYFFEGVRRGFVEQTLELIGFFLTVALALATYHWFGGVIVEKIGVQEAAANPIAFIVAWFIFQLLYSIILRYSYPYIPAKIRQAPSNRWSGLLPAFMKGLIIISIILTVTVSFPGMPTKLKSEINASALGSRLVNNSSAIDYFLNKVTGGNFDESLGFLTVPTQTEQVIDPSSSVDLKFTTTEITVDKASEQKMLTLINEERAKIGLAALVFDEKLAAVGRAHDQDMFARGFFAHENPDGLSPFDRMDKAGIIFKVAGENIAYAPNVDLAHNGLMRSPGHRANILSPDYKRVGIGVVDGGTYGKMFSQEFTD